MVTPGCCTPPAARRPQRVGRLALITPSTAAVGVPVPAEARRATARPRREEPWSPTAFAALRDITAGRATADGWANRRPGRRRALPVRPVGRGGPRPPRGRRRAARPGGGRLFAAEGAFSPDAVRAAPAGLGVPVLAPAGEADLTSPPAAAAEVAAPFPRADYAERPGAGHFPWPDDAGRFTARTAGFPRRA